MVTHPTNQNIELDIDLYFVHATNDATTAPKFRVFMRSFVNIVQLCFHIFVENFNHFCYMFIKYQSINQAQLITGRREWTDNSNNLAEVNVNFC